MILTHFSSSHQFFLSQCAFKAELCDPWVSRFFIGTKNIVCVYYMDNTDVAYSQAESSWHEYTLLQLPSTSH